MKSIVARTLLLFLLLNSNCVHSSIITGSLDQYLYLGTTEWTICDIDNNGIYDLEFFLIDNGTSPATLHVVGLDGTKVAVTAWNDDIYGFYLGQPMATNNYANSGNIKLPHFPQAVSKFMGFSLNINGVGHCGYMRVMSNLVTFGLFEFAYETDSGICINAGATASTPETAYAAHISKTLYPNPTHDVLNIKVSKGGVIEKITISDLKGIIIFTMDVDPNSTQYQLKLSDLNAGVYIVSFLNKDQLVDIDRIIKI